VFFTSRAGMSNSNYLAGRKSNKNCQRDRQSEKSPKRATFYKNNFLEMSLFMNCNIFIIQNCDFYTHLSEIIEEISKIIINQVVA